MTATFILSNPVKLTVSKVKQVSGDGTVVSSPGGISCGSTCSAFYATGVQITLTASANAGSTFASWSGCTSSSDTTCTVTMDRAKVVKATFIGPQTLTVKNTSVNKGSGAVISDLGDINCASGSAGVCRTLLPYDTSVTLTAIPDDGSSVAGWSISGCTGTTCTVTMIKAQTVTVKFKK